MKLAKTPILEGELDLVISGCRKEVKKRKGASLKRKKVRENRIPIIVEEQKE